VVNAATEQFVEEIPFEGVGVRSVAVNTTNDHMSVSIYERGIFVVAPGKPQP
jgi:hypothetical protein